MSEACLHRHFLLWECFGLNEDLRGLIQKNLQNVAKGGLESGQISMLINFHVITVQ